MKDKIKMILGGEEYTGTIATWKELDEKTGDIQSEGGWMEYLGSDCDSNGGMYHAFSEMYMDGGMQLEGEMLFVSGEKVQKPIRSNLDDGKIWALAHGRAPWTLQAIAEEMGCSVTTVHVHLERMRKERGEY